MANSVKTIDLIAKAAVVTLENNLVMGNLVYRDYEAEFQKSINGFKVGDTVSIRKPTDFVVTDGATMTPQDVVEGSTSITVNRRKHVAFSFSSQDLTQKIDKLTERVIEPAMIQLANQVDADVMSLYKQVPGWVGTPGQVINSYADYAKAPERMDELAVLANGRASVLSPADHWALLGSQTGLFIQDAAKSAYRQGSLGMIGGVDTNMSQNVPTHVVGVATGTPLVQGAAQGVTYLSVKDTYTQTLNTDGWTNSTTGILKAGDVFTITGVYAVNPVSKATLPFLRQFAVVADANSGASTGPAALTITPPIIVSGAFQTVSNAPADDAPIQVMGTGGTGYRQNMAFHRNAFALAMAPLVNPPGAVSVSRQSYKGVSVRVIPVYDGTNDLSTWRLDILYGVKAIDPRQAVRFSGSP